MIVGFTGTGSEPGMVRAQVVSALALLRELGATELHHGDCVWADDHAHRIARKLGLRVVIHPPENPSRRAWCDPAPEGAILPPRPYLDRNRDIVDGTEVLLASPREQTGETLRSGTWSTVRYARRIGRPVYILRPDGTVER